MLELSLEEISAVATTISAVIGASSLVAGFLIYNIGRRDQKLKEMRESMVIGKATANQLDELLSIDVAYEVYTSASESVIVSTFINEVWRLFFSNPDTTLEELDAYLDEKCPIIFASITAPKVEQFQQGLRTLEIEAAKLEYEYPGTARALYAARNILRNAYRVQKRIVLAEEVWQAGLKQVFEDAKADNSTLETFKSEISQRFISTSLGSLKERGQATINDTLQALDIVVRAYLEKSPKQLLRAAKLQKSRTLISLSDTETVAEDVRQLEEGMRGTLSNDDILTLRQLATQIDTRES